MIFHIHILFLKKINVLTSITMYTKSFKSKKWYDNLIVCPSFYTKLDCLKNVREDQLIDRY
jgi:hypothetical protein